MRNWQAAWAKQQGRASLLPAAIPSEYAFSDQHGGDGTMRYLRLAGLCLVLFADNARPENLHQKFGAYWNCSYITTGTSYKDICEACERRGMEFDRQGNGGICVPKTSQSSRPERDVERSRPSKNNRLAEKIERARILYNKAVATIDRAKADLALAKSSDECLKQRTLGLEISMELVDLLRDEDDSSFAKFIHNLGDRIHDREVQYNDAVSDCVKTQVAEEDKRTVQPPSYALRICNRYDKALWISVAVFDRPEDDELTVQGWWDVRAKSCSYVLTRSFGKYSSHTIYVHAENDDWSFPRSDKADSSFCVSSGKSFGRKVTKDYQCLGKEVVRAFSETKPQKGLNEDHVTHTFYFE